MTTLTTEVPALGLDDFMPSGEVARLEAYRNAVTLIHELRQNPRRELSHQERLTLAHFPGAGSIGPHLFDPEFTPENVDVKDRSLAQRCTEVRGLLTDVLSEADYLMARSTMLNAHFTDPRIAEVMWEIALGLGFKGGLILEPSVGSGVFVGTMPIGALPESHLVGVEIDPLTADVAGHLWRDLDGVDVAVRNEAFEDARLPEGTFDLVIANPPYGKYPVHDPIHNPDGYTVCNYFVAKSLALLRPGGILVAAVSRYLLDSQRNNHRVAFHRQADLVGAVRLPSSAHRAAAGTNVVTDVIVLRKRLPGERPQDNAWLTSSVWYGITPGFEPVTINNYLMDGYHQPDGAKFIGRPNVGNGMNSRSDLLVRWDDTYEEMIAHLRIATRRLVDQAHEYGLTYEPPVQVAPVPVSVIRIERRKPASIHVEGDGFVQIDAQGLPQPWEPSPKGEAKEVRELIALRDAFYAVLETQRDNEPDENGEECEAVTSARAELNRIYDAYVKRHGPIGRATRYFRKSKEDPDAPPVPYYRRPSCGGFRGNTRRMGDPDFPTLLALEDYHEDTATATKAPVFEHRVIVRSPEPPSHCDDPSDAFLVSLNTRGELDLADIAARLGVEEDEATRTLADLRLIFLDPESGHWQTATIYLSGHVRQKLAFAERAATHDPLTYAANVEALGEVLPPWVGPNDIYATIGAMWIPADVYEDFSKEVFETEITVTHDEDLALWEITNSWRVNQVKLTSEWGTHRINALLVLKASLGNQRAEVKDPVPGERNKYMVNHEETLAAQAKQEDMSVRFGTWCWENHERADRLVELFNWKLNSYVQPGFDGSHLTFPGMSPNIQLRPHQVNAVWRTVHSPFATLYNHQVGTGKSFCLVASAMTLVRLGRARKVLAVVPNNILEQFCADARRLYPGASIFMWNEDMGSAKLRTHAMAMVASGDWDLVVMARSAFERMQMPKDITEAFLHGQIDELERLAERAKAEGRRHSMREAERQIKVLQARIDKLSDRIGQDNGVDLTMMGVNWLMVDEAHEFKRLPLNTSMQGISSGQSERAQLLLMVADWLTAQTGGKHRPLTFSTGTPISNGLYELWVMKRFLIPEVLKDLHMLHFDTWASTFGEQVTKLEISPDGGSFRIHTRFASYVNQPELMRIFLLCSDIVVADDTGIARPDLDYHTIVVSPSAETRQYVGSLVQRMEKVRKKEDLFTHEKLRPKDDNALRVTTHGRKVALWPPLAPILNGQVAGWAPEPTNPDELLREPTTIGGMARRMAAEVGIHIGGPKLSEVVAEGMSADDDKDDDDGMGVLWLPHHFVAPPENGGKPQMVANQVAALWETTKDLAYLDIDGRPSSERGASHVIFCDMGTPNKSDEVLVEDEDGDLVGWQRLSVYDEIRQRLIDNGVSGERIVFIHDAKNSRKRQAIFDRVNRQATVLVASTSKAGLGSNFQNRLISLHHVDPPWKPAEVLQRWGRIERQGNQNLRVLSYIYVVEGTFDAYMWQGLERKARFLAQLQSGQITDRKVDEITDTMVLDFEAIKAAATGNQLVLRQAEVNADLAKLRRASSAHKRDQSRLSADHRRYHQEIADAERRAAELGRLRRRIGEDPEVSLADVDVETGEELHEALVEILRDWRKRQRQVGNRTWEQDKRIGLLGDVTLYLTASGGVSSWVEPQFTVYDDVGTKLSVSATIKHPVDDIAKLPLQIDKLAERQDFTITNSQRHIAEIEPRLNLPFDREDELSLLEAELRAINEEMNAVTEDSGDAFRIPTDLPLPDAEVPDWLTDLDIDDARTEEQDISSPEPETCIPEPEIQVEEHKDNVVAHPAGLDEAASRLMEIIDASPNIELIHVTTPKPPAVPRERQGVNPPRTRPTHERKLVAVAPPLPEPGPSEPEPVLVEQASLFAEPASPGAGHVAGAVLKAEDLLASARSIIRKPKPLAWRRRTPKA